MAYWGQFEALGFGGKFGPMQEEKRAALEKAKSLASKASDHEQFHIRAAEHQDNPTILRSGPLTRERWKL
jgi:hypothetical protein